MQQQYKHIFATSAAKGNRGDGNKRNNVQNRTKESYYKSSLPHSSVY
jgi:hypothetical protein